MVIADFYPDGEYLKKNPSWHVGAAPYLLSLCLGAILILSGTLIPIKEVIYYNKVGHEVSRIKLSAG